MSQSQTVLVGQLAERDRQGNVDIIDVRTPLEFREVRAVVARNSPLDVLDPHTVMKERNGSTGERLYVINVEGGAIAAMVTGDVYLAGIPAFVGAGLMFAGITDSCAMGMLVAKMPWNRTWAGLSETGSESRRDSATCKSIQD